MSSLRSWRQFACALAALALGATTAAAQAATGRIAGTVTDSTRAPIANAQVAVTGTNRGALTGIDGRYVIAGLPAGSYTVRVQRIGEIARTIPNVAVTAGGTTTLDVVLARATARLAGVVVSASRREERITDAPVTISRLEASEIAATAGNSFGPALKAVKGVDFIQTGMLAVGINARGFNSAFNNRMLQMEDGRIAVLPENGLPVGNFTTIPKVDLAAVEVVVGPGSALYGPDASNGVVTLTTKDPKQFPGTTLEATVGNRSYTGVQLRHAGVTGDGRIGFKVTAEHSSADDWENTNFYAPVIPGQRVRESNASFNTNVTRGGGSLVWYAGNGGRLELSGGASLFNGLGNTNVGRNQLENWQYRHVQARWSSEHWFAQAYRAQSQSGGTYQLNAFSQNQVRFPTLSVDSLRNLSDFPTDGRLNAAEIQNNFRIAPLFDTRVVWGGQFRRDQVSSNRQWLTDRFTGEDIVIDQLGGYAQVETPWTSWLRTVFAGRYDRHDFYDPQFSPKAALLWTPVRDNTFRISYNRAFKSPTTLQTSFFFPNFSPPAAASFPGIGVINNRNGFTVRNAAGVVQQTFAAIEPEVNDTYEVGYKGVFAEKLFVDVAGYRSFYDAFLSPLVTVANPLAGTFFHDNTGARFTDPTTGAQQIALTYLNLGKARVRGADAGVRYLFADDVVFNGTWSWIRLDRVERRASDPNNVPGQFAEATSLNAPSVRWNAGIDWLALGAQGRGRFGVSVRSSQTYRFTSGVNNGFIPGFWSLDLSGGWRLPRQGAVFNVSVQNLFTCQKGRQLTPQWVAAAQPWGLDPNGGRCGFGRKHVEFLNAPAIGTMVFAGLRFDR
ncbi:MAG: TonB-dependent receptor [Gemmatimonadaceae bacterium]|nr:TonB-dependent receptor [Gemmatimonadaceae bacterium]